jgi:nicotinamidase-related amidase
MADTRAVIVIDLQTGMLDGVKFPPLHNHQALLARTAEVLDWARAGGVPVIFIRHNGEEGDALAPGAPGWPIHPAIAPLEGEAVVGKNVGDAFAESDLETRLRDQGVSEVILLGAQTDQCVNATFGGALSRRFDITVVGDTHSTWDWNGETADQIIARHNRSFAEAGARVIDAAELIAAD